MLINPQTQRYLDEIVVWVAAQELEVLKADAAITAMKQLQAILPQLREIRVAAMRNMTTQGWSETDMAKELGISRARVHQLME